MLGIARPEEPVPPLHVLNWTAEDEGRAQAALAKLDEIADDWGVAFWTHAEDREIVERWAGRVGRG